MATPRNLTQVTALLDTIETLQTQLADQYHQLADSIDKITDGKQYAGESNVAFIKYWSQVAADHPEILAGDFPKAAFAERLPHYERLIRIFKKEKEIMAILTEPTAHLSQDLIHCANTVYGTVQDRTKNAVFRKLLQESPQVYKKAKPDDNGAAIAKDLLTKALPQAAA